MVRLLLIAGVMIATPAAAQYYTPPSYGYGYSAPRYQAPRTSYDWQSGNSYTTQQQMNGSTSVRGFNARTGSTWNTTIERDGTQRGTDASGNMWRQSPNGFYQNYGTGRMCTGTGYARVCN